MVNYQERSNRSETGKKYRQAHKKRRNRYGRNPIETKIAPERKKFVRTRGGSNKVKLHSIDTINVSIPEEKITKKLKIEKLENNISSKDYDRRSVITKGAIIETELGFVRVTSRPGQDGQMNGVLIKKE